MLESGPTCKFRSSKVQVQELIQTGELLVSYRIIVVLAVVKETRSSFNRVGEEVVEFREGSQAPVVGNGAVENRQLGVGVDSVVAVYDIASANLIFGADVIVYPDTRFCLLT